MNTYTIKFFAVLIFFGSNLFAQEVKFGKVTKKELEQKTYPADSSANAVVLYKKRDTHYEYNAATGWSLTTEVHERIKLYNKEGFKNATKKVRIYTLGGRNGNESLGVKGYTYNLIDGKIVKTKLDQKNIFNEETSKNWESNNFTMPNLKEGCIIEWKYTINSPYTSYINDVICQYKIPIKYLNVKIQIPEFYEFKYIVNRYYPISVKESQTLKKYSFVLKSGHVTNKGRTTLETKPKREFNTTSIIEKTYTVKAENIPALIEEDYVSNIYNYQAKINFEITAHKPNNGPSEYFNNSWDNVAKTIYGNAYFGVELNKKSHFKEDLKNVLNGLNSENEKMYAILKFVKSKIKWNENYGKYVSYNGIKEAYNNGAGNVAEINLTLVAMLRGAGLQSNPIVLSTRNHGIPIFPTSKGFNYVIAGIELSDGFYLLDATEKYSLPNVLPLRDLNWEGLQINEGKSSAMVDLYPSIYNLKNIKLSVQIDTEGNVTGMMNSNLKNLYALQYREAYNSLSEDDMISDLETENEGIEIDKIRINNKQNLSRPVNELIKFSKENQVDIIGDKMYISPLLFLTIHENPFKLKKREYPIDYGSPWKNSINISIQIPDGYKVDSKPEDLSLALPDDLGTYSMDIKVNGNNIQINSMTRINKALIGSNYYSSLKELYKRAIDNQLEKIILVQAEL